MNSLTEKQIKLKMQILEARERRVGLIQKLVKSDYVIVSLRANYPGDYKDQEVTRLLVNEIATDLKTQVDIRKQVSLNCGEGLVYIYQLQSNEPNAIKEQMINIENRHPLGRLVDLDVYYKSEKSVSRSDLNYRARDCFLCNQVAFHCMRQLNHTVEELTTYIHRVVEEYAERGLLSKTN